MANETNSIMNFKDKNGVNHEIYPVTKIENVEGLSNALDAKANADTVSTLANTVSAKADASALASKVDKVSGKGLSTNDYTTAEKNKLAGVAEGANKTTTDTSLSSTSGNPIANKTVYTALAAKADSTALASVSNSIDTKISAAIDALIDGAPETYDTLKEIADYLATHQNEYTALLTTIAGKVDKVSGKGLSTEDFTTALKNKLDGIATGANKTTVDTALSSTSGNPVANSAVNTALGNKVDKVSGKGLSTNDYTTAEKNKLAGIAAGANAYSLPTASSSVLGGVKTGSNITNSSGTISITKDNVTSALGYTPPTQDTTYGAATTSANGLMSSSDKTKLDGIATGANKTTVDTALSSSSGNPIANSTVNTAVSSLNSSVSSQALSISNLSASVSAANSRIDTFTNLKAGSTTGDAELIDGRVGADGKTYTNIGGAIRGQVSDLKSDVTQIENVSKNLIDLNTLVRGKYVNYSTGNEGTSSSYGYVTVDILGNTDYLVDYTLSSVQVAFFNNNTYISGVEVRNAEHKQFKSPSTANKAKISFEIRFEKVITMQKLSDYNDILRKNQISYSALSEIINKAQLINKDFSVIGKYINYSSGTEGTSSSYRYTWISIDPDTEYEILNASETIQIAFFRNDTYVSGVNVKNTIFRSPSNANRLTISYKNDDSEAIVLRAAGGEYIKRRFVDVDFVNSKVISKQLVDKSTAVEGKYINYTTGKEGTNASFSYVYVNNIKANTKYTVVNSRDTQVAFFNNNTYISGIAMHSGEFTSPSNANRLAISYLTADNVVLRELFEDNGDKIKNSLIDIDYINEKVKSNIIECGANKQFTRLRDAVAKGVELGCKVVVYPGTYDLASEFATELANKTKPCGCTLDNNVHILFMPGAKVKCLLQKNESDKWAYGNCEPFVARSGSGFTLENLDIEAANTRYCVHDEHDGSGTYTNNYINCRMKYTNEYEYESYTSCIGGGLGEHGYINIDGGVYESVSRAEDKQIPISYHNGVTNTTKSDIYIKNVYLKNKGKLNFSSYGGSTNKTQCNVNNCSFGAAIVTGVITNDLSPSGTINMEVVDFNNIVRN